MRRYLSLTAVALAVAVSAPAQTTSGTDGSLARGTPLPTGTAAARWAGNTLYVSGALDPDISLHADMTSQTVGLITYLH